MNLAPIASVALDRVSTLELFFDLVFVFTVTQVTHVLVDTPNPSGLARASLELGVICWMYGGYAWMTNSAGPDTWQRRVLI
jgi:low temperature requirement protein LtrA